MKNLKRLIGPALDKVGQAEAELAAAERELGEVRAAIARHQAEARRLATDWLHAATQDVAEQFDRQRREALRLVEGDNARIPALEALLVAAKAEKHPAFAATAPVGNCRMRAGP